MTGPLSFAGAPGPAGARTPAAARVRKVMLYSHDTYGLGHLRRNLRIAGHLLASAPELQIVLVSGSSVAEYFPAPPGLTVVKLPSVRKVGADQYRPVNARLDISLVRRTRTAIMVDAVRRFRPDVLLVDHSPAGMNGELLDVFTAVHDHSPSTRVALGLRDILDDPDTVVRTWTEQGIYSLLADVYDQIVVYGSRDVFDVGHHSRLPATVADRLVYTGYLAPGTTRPRPDAGGTEPTAPYLLATAGGGGDGVAVLAGAMAAGATLGMPTKVITGPLIDDEAFDALRAQADRTGGVELVKFHPQLHRAMGAASAVITMGGYNSLCEAISVRVPTVVVPRSQPRLEQTIRAGLFAERGLVATVAAGPDLGARLARAVLHRAPAPPTEALIDLGGLDRLRTALLVPAPGRGAEGRPSGVGDHVATGRVSVARVAGTEGDERPAPDRLADRLPA